VLGRAAAGRVTLIDAYSKYSAFNRRIREHAQLEFALIEAAVAVAAVFVRELADVLHSVGSAS